MNHTKYNIPEETMDKIIRVAYGDASAKDKREINQLAMRDESVQKLLNEYLETANSVHEIKIDECPPELVERANKGTIKHEVPKRSFVFELYSLVFSKPLVSAVAIGILVAAIVTSIFINRNNMYEGYSLAEIERANSEARMALALVGKIFNETGNSITQEILTDKVGKPINEGIKSVNKLFKEGEQK